MAAISTATAPAPTEAFEPSLFVWATMMSHPTDDRALQR
jgi:hypothetical protein